jgi:hypothetical protein
MKVKVGDKVYDGGREPVMVILTSIDKANISAMADGAFRYCSFPESFGRANALAWMSAVPKAEHTPSRLRYGNAVEKEDKMENGKIAKKLMAEKVEVTIKFTDGSSMVFDANEFEYNIVTEPPGISPFSDVSFKVVGPVTMLPSTRGKRKAMKKAK